jgi:hypothetical protein
LKQKSQHTLARITRAAGFKLFFSYPPLRNGSHSSCWPRVVFGSLLNDGGRLVMGRQISHRENLSRQSYFSCGQLTEHSIQSWVRRLVFCHYLITLSALASTLGGIVRPICLAALRFMMSSNFFGCSTGRSPGFLPFRILSTMAATRRFMSSRSGP